MKTATEAKGIIEMIGTWGGKTSAEVMVDSSAALGVIGRRGSGKLRHIWVGQLWIQEAAENEELIFRKVNGKDNPADICTKNLTQGKLDQLLTEINLEVRDGKAVEGLDIG